MLDIKLLGTGGMMPLLDRYLTAGLIKYNGISILVDCGEATQLALRNADESTKDIDVICITHFHADHIGGLIGLMLLMGNQGKTSQLTIIGPKGIEKVVESMRVIAPVLPYKVVYKEILTSYCNWRLNEITEHSFKEFTIRAFRVNHKVECYGYTFELDRLPKFNVNKALELGLAKKFWGILQRGEPVSVGGKLYTSNMVLGEPRKGLKVTYCTDTRPCEPLIQSALDSDLLICEAMYGDTDKKQDALEKKHMMMSEAAEIARAANVKELWITHFSPSMMYPQNYLRDTKKIFDNTVIPKCGQHKKLCFED